VTAGRICCECQQAIHGEAKKITRHSASGVRPDDYAHPDQCPDARQGRSTVARYMLQHP
jgi:hypothetical protein